MVNMNDWLATGEMLKREAPATARLYPRIIERFQYLWSEPEDCRKCFKNLLMKDSLDQHGFPVDVMGELMHLNKMFERSHPKPLEYEAMAEGHYAYSR